MKQISRTSTSPQGSIISFRGFLESIKEDVMAIDAAQPFRLGSGLSIQFDDTTNHIVHRKMRQGRVERSCGGGDERVCGDIFQFRMQR